MTEPGRLAEQLAGASRAALLLDGTPDSAVRFSSWFCAAWRGALTYDLTAEAFETWARVLDSPRIFAWWQGTAHGKRALPVEALARGLAGAARIESHNPGEWVPAESPPDTRSPAAGRLAVTWCMLRGDPAEVIDLIAMDPGRPAEHWLRTGLADVLPNADGLLALECGQRLRLFRYPLDWLAAGCPVGAFCILDWAGWAAENLLRELDAGTITVFCDDDAHAAELRGLARPKRAGLQLQVATA